MLVLPYFIFANSVIYEILSNDTTDKTVDKYDNGDGTKRDESSEMIDSKHDRKIEIERLLIIKPSKYISTDIL
jgi:hypothetical protein